MNRHVPAPPPARERLAPGKPDRLVFAWEPFRVLARELRPLFQLHWEELALDQDTVPLDPDWDQYYDLDLRGVLRILTARRAGRLVGYVFNVCGRHSHYASTPWAATDMFWLHPECRGGWEGVRFLLANRNGLREMGARVHTIAFKLSFADARVGKLLQRLGYAPADIVMRQSWPQ